MSNAWSVIGNLGDYDSLIKSHDPTIYQWGIRYNTITVTPVVIQTWNRGVRIFSEFTYSMGDNASEFTVGRAMFTRGTDDEESKTGFYHRYVDVNFKPIFGSNGCQNHLQVYVRKF